LWSTRNLVKYLLPEGDDLLHIVACCKSLASHVVLFRDGKTRNLMGPTLATGLLNNAMAGILWITLSKIPTSLPVVSISLEISSLARFEDLLSDTAKIRLSVFLNMTPFTVTEVCPKFGGPNCHFPQGLEVAAAVSAEAFVIF
jgi:hypothetical protein